MNEERFISKFNSAASTTPESYIYSGRVRYQLKGIIPLSGTTVEEHEYYFSSYDEIFIGYGKNVGENIFDQNRFAFLVGHQFTDNLKIEAGFFQQILQLAREVGGKNVFQYNNGLMVNAHLSF